MSDFLVNLGANPTARSIITKLGLPLPMPQKLERGSGPWSARPLEGLTVIAGQAADTGIADTLAPALAELGAAMLVEADLEADSPWLAAGEAAGRPATGLGLGEVPDDKVHALVLDATGVSGVADLKALMTFFSPRVKHVARNGRVVVIGRPHETAPDVDTSAARRALSGFVKSLAKEVGGKGTTANVLLVDEGAEAGLAGPLRFLLSRRSAFVDGQVLRVSGEAKAADPVWEQPLAGKVALVTGSARGIGEATARALAREGAHVLCLDIPPDAEALAEVAHAIGGTAVACDITASDAAATILAAADKLGGLDIVVHNAGVTRDKTLAKMDDSRWDLTLAVNLQAILRVTDELAPKLNDGGRIVALSSVAGIAGNFGQTNYAASKAGVIGFIEASAPRWAKRGITVNGIAPGFIETRMTAAIPAATREAGRRLSALVQGGQPVDIAEAVTFLASPGSWGVNGRVLRVCGGAFIGA